jgi:translation initiation factor 1
MTDKIIFSTRTGDLRKQPPPSPGLAISKPPTQQNLKVMRSKKGRRGKVVTVIAGFALTEADLKAMTKLLKTFCGAGGAIKVELDGTQQTIEIQGDHRSKIVENLQNLGYKAKLAGG